MLHSQRFTQRVIVTLGLLIIGGAFAIATPGTVNAAANCKPNRATCTASNQCCSKLCSAGTCQPDGGTVCPRCGDGVVNGSEACDRQATPTTCNFDCTVSNCGDGQVNPNAAEQCDDGNTDAGDGCHNCSYERCGNGVLDFGEDCDGSIPPTDYGCSADCVQIACGNGRLEPGEECDDGNDSDDDNCLSSDPSPEACRVAGVCGEGTVLVGSECQPDYTALCGAGTEVVAGQCVSATPPPSSCGDGAQDDGEECDDGNTVDETECDYGLGNCLGCSADCTELTLTGPFCGDGEVTTCPEVCDDNNALACGTCSASCATSQLAHATGLILAVDDASLNDGETFTLDDGFGTVEVFEFDADADVVGGNVRIDLSGDASSMATKIVDAIEGSLLGIDAVATSNLVNLVNQRASSLGNTLIAETVADADFFVNGMAGGAGGDCATGVGCSTDDDCASGVCSPGIHECEDAVEP